MPETPAAHQFHAWLDAANSEDERRLRRFIEESCSSLTNRRPVSGLSFGRGGGYDLRRTEEETESSFVGVVEDRIHGFCFRIRMEIEPHKPWPLVQFTVQSVPRAGGGSRVARMSEADALAAFQEYLTEATAHDLFSGAVLVAKHGNEVFSGAYGLADRERRIANSVGTIFHTASMGKMFTAISVLQLVQAGQVDLSESLGRYVPDWPNQAVADTVTVHHLLTHTSGIDEVYGPVFDAYRDRIQTLDDYVTVFGDRDLEFEPGSDWAYNNYGFTLLALIVERVTRQDFRDYVQEHVFGPAEMGATTYGPGEGMANHALSYYRDPENAQWRQSETGPIPADGPGGALMPVEDMKRFASALLDHRLLDESHTHLLTTGTVRVETRGNRYAYGFQDYVVDGVRWFGHGGGGASVNADLRVYPDSGYVVVVFASMSPPAAVRMSAFIGDRLPVS